MTMTMIITLTMAMAPMTEPLRLPIIRFFFFTPFWTFSSERGKKKNQPMFILL